MFDSLKKRLKDALNKATALVGKEEKIEEEIREKQTPSADVILQKIREEQVHPADELPKEEVRPDAEVSHPATPEKLKPKHADALLQKEVEVKPEAEPRMPQELTKIEVAKEKKSFLGGLLRKVTEKKLSEGDVNPILAELRNALLENDVSVETAETICDDVKKNLIGKDVSRGKAEDAVKDALRTALLGVMNQERMDVGALVEKKWNTEHKPYLVMFFGFNGVGKTTTIAKFAHRFKAYSPVLAAGDTFRAASIEQLEEHASRLGTALVKHKYGSDSAAVIFDAVKHAAASGCRLVLADTAGRSHSNMNLMDELKKVVRVNRPDLKVLVLDSLTGNDIYEQSRLFSDAVGVDAVILTKADVYQRGGAALSAAHTLKKPILFLGTGQEYSDLEEFDAEEIVRNLLE